MSIPPRTKDFVVSLTLLDEVLGILSFHKEQIQIISVVHNPLLIYALSKNKEVNIIELTDGYVNRVCSKVESIIKL